MQVTSTPYAPAETHTADTEQTKSKIESLRQAIKANEEQNAHFEAEIQYLMKPKTVIGLGDLAFYRGEAYIITYSRAHRRVIAKRHEDSKRPDSVRWLDLAMPLDSVTFSQSNHRFSQSRSFDDIVFDLPAGLSVRC